MTKASALGVGRRAEPVGVVASDGSERAVVVGGDGSTVALGGDGFAAFAAGLEAGLAGGGDRVGIGVPGTWSGSPQAMHSGEVT